MVENQNDAGFHINARVVVIAIFRRGNAITGERQGRAHVHIVFKGALKIFSPAGNS